MTFVERVTKQGSPDLVPESERVATFGSSMGGGNALAAAAEDRAIAAAISQVPFLDIVMQAHRSSYACGAVSKDIPCNTKSWLR